MSCFPVIRLEIEGMRHLVHAALTEYTAQMDQDIRAAVDSYCTPENMRAVIHAEATRQMDIAVRKAVEMFFSVGGGQRAVIDVVKQRLEERLLEVKD